MDELDTYLDSLETLKYSELRKLAKKFGVRANLKGDKIISALRELSDHSTPTTVTTQQDEGVSTATDSDHEISQKPKKGRKMTKGMRGRKHHQSTKQSSDEDEIQLKKSACLKPVGMKSPVCKASLSGRKFQPFVSSPLTKTPVSQTPVSRTPGVEMTNKLQISATRQVGSVKRTSLIPTIPNSNIKTATPKSTMPKSGMKSTTPKSGVKSTTPKSGVKSTTPKSGVKSTTPKSGVKSTTPKSGTKSTTPKSGIKSTTPKSATPSSTSKRTGSGRKSTPQQGRQSVEKSNPQVNGSGGRTRRDTYTCDEASPGVTELINVMTGDMTHDEQKQSLMAELDKKVHQKKASQAENASHIPRLVGLSNMADKSKDEAKKTTASKRTPGKDWKKIHRQNWAKMDSIDDYLAKKRKRTESMTQSVKKMKMASEQMKASIHSLKKPKTPASGIKSAVKVSRPVLAKPVTRPTKTSLFQSPAPAIFKPKVISVANANFNFGKICNKEKSVLIGNKTPGNPTRKSPRAGLTKSSKKPLFTIGKATPSASKENITNKTFDGNASRSLVTPLKQASNTSINTANKFDIKESLSKPMSWKPHTGKLKPFVMGSMFKHEKDVKEVQVKSRKDRRAEHVKQRDAKRKENFSQRRAVQF